MSTFPGGRPLVRKVVGFSWGCDERPAAIIPQTELKPKHLAFVIEYMKDKNAAQAAIRAGYSAKAARPVSSRLLSNAMVAAEVKRLQDEYKRTAGIETVALLEVAKRAAFADPRKAFDGNGNVLPRQLWPDELIGAIAGYKAAGLTTPEEIKFHDAPSMAMKLLDHFKAVPAAVANVTQNIQINATNAVIELNALLPEG
jgi:phage terminase small subunit